MKKSSQEISVLHIEFPLHTILIIGGTILEIDWHISHFWPRTLQNQKLSTLYQWPIFPYDGMNVEHGAQILVRQYLARIQH